MAADDIGACVTYWCVIILIMAFAGIFRFSFVFFLGPSPYGETYLSSGIAIIICILVICLVCYFLGGGFDNRYSNPIKPIININESNRIKNEYSRKRRCPNCGKRINRKAIRCKYCKTMLKEY